MRRLPGQAARMTGRALHRVFTLLLLLALGAATLAGALAWRLSQGPVDLPWLAARMQEAANAESGPVQMVIGHASLAWEGFRLGVDRPLDIRLRDISISDPSLGQSVVLPQVDVSLALGGLMLGRIQPRALDIEGARLVLLRTQAGEVRLDFAPLEEAGADAPAQPETSVLTRLMAELARPPAALGNRDGLGHLSQLRRVRLLNSTFLLVDRQLAVVWRAEAPEIDLRRQAHGGMLGSASLNLAMGAERASVRLNGTLSPGAEGIRLSVQLANFNPAVLARQTGTLDLLKALDASLSGSLDLEIGSHQELRRLALDLHAGAGKVTIGPDTVLLAGADIAAEGTDRDLRLQSFGLRVQPRADGPVSTLSGSGRLQRNAGRVRSELSLAVDQVAFADLGSLWPSQIGRPAHDWITRNITAGMVRDGQARVALETAEDFSDIALTEATGSLLGEGVTVHWLRPVPPIDRGTARLNILDPDTFEILVSSGRQTLDTGSRESGLVIKSGKMRIIGIIHKDQIGYIDAELAGPIADALTLLRNKKLHLFDKVQIDLNNPGGQLSGTLSVTVPLEEKLQIEQVPIQTRLHLQDASLAGLVAGRDLDHGNVDIDANVEGMKLTGQAEIAGISTQLDMDMNFRSGPPTQIVRRIVATSRTHSRQLAAAGLDAGDALAGDLSLKAEVIERRNGAGEILVDADLAGATLRIDPIGWQKPAGQAAAGHARLQLSGSRLVGIDDITLDGRGSQGNAPLMLRAQASFADRRVTGLTIDQAVLGRTSGHGTVRFPADSGPIRLAFEGPGIDLAPVLSSKPEPGHKPEPEKAGPSWTLDARFDRAFMANATIVRGLVARVEHDGRIVRTLHVSGQTGPADGGAGFQLNIVPPAGARPRTLNAVADNAGDLLRAVDVAHKVQGGRLTVTGTYDDTQADHPLSGTAEIQEFRVRDAPALGRLLQAMTLYGLVDVMQGPGLAFDRLVAPMRLTREVLELREARAFSSSLGLTAKGRVDLVQDLLDMEGTIVPAYFFNSLLGNLPLIGRLFSPEEGGGLFAASYSIRGAGNDPQVTVNPLSALTPGFLRGLFGIF